MYIRVKIVLDKSMCRPVSDVTHLQKTSNIQILLLLIQVNAFTFKHVYVFFFNYITVKCKFADFLLVKK